MILLLLACADDAPKATGDDYHLLFSGQAPLRGLDAPGLWETDLDLVTVWSHELPPNQGTFGAIRVGSETLLARSGMPPESNPAVERLDANGKSVWTSGSGAGFGMPHGIDVGVDGEIVVGDVLTYSFYGLDPTGNRKWSFEVAGAGGAPSGLAVGEVNGVTTMIGSIIDEPPLGEASSEDRVMAWDLEDPTHPLLWEWPPYVNPSLCLWDHNPHFQLDGSILVSMAGLGQIVELDPATGTEVARFPPDDQPVLTFPRDAVMLPDGDLIVVDPTEVYRVRDPYGSFTIVDSEPVAFGYTAMLLDCRKGECQEG